MPSSRRPVGLFFLCAAAVTAVAVLTGCSAPGASVPAASAPAQVALTASATSTASFAPTATFAPMDATATDAPDAGAPAQGEYSALCAANRAAATAKAGTVGDDMTATSAQVKAIQALLPLRGVSADVAAGAKVFEASAKESAAILATFPADKLVSDVGLDPKFTSSAALQSALTDPQYQAFIAWAIQTCRAN